MFTSSRQSCRRPGPGVRTSSPDPQPKPTPRPSGCQAGRKAGRGRIANLFPLVESVAVAHQELPHVLPALAPANDCHHHGAPSGLSFPLASRPASTADTGRECSCAARRYWPAGAAWDEPDQKQAGAHGCSLDECKRRMAPYPARFAACRHHHRRKGCPSAREDVPREREPARDTAVTYIHLPPPAPAELLTRARQQRTAGRFAAYRKGPSRPFLPKIPRKDLLQRGRTGGTRPHTPSPTNTVVKGALSFLAHAKPGQRCYLTGPAQ